jgi:hypothetical protein
MRILFKYNSKEGINMKQVRLGLFVIMFLLLLLSCETVPKYYWLRTTDCGYDKLPSTEKKNLKEPKINFNIDSEPKDAKVYVAGKYVANTPITLQLSYKEWDLYENEVLAEYWVNQFGAHICYRERPIKETRSVFLRHQIEYYWYAIDIYKENYKPGRLIAETRPEEKRNFVCFLEKEAAPYHSPIQQQQQQQQQIIIEKDKGSSYLSVTSDPPGAEVYLDDNLIGTTPIANTKLKPGSYSLRVVKGNKTWERNILLPEEGSLQIKAELK